MLYFLLAAHLATLAIAAGVIVFAWKRGEQDERAVATALFLGIGATQMVGLIQPATSFQPAGMAVDVILATYLIYVMLRSARFWPLWAAAAQFCGAMTHLAAIRPTSLPVALYATTQAMWIFPILIALTAGTIAKTTR